MAGEEGNSTSVFPRLKGYLKEIPFFCKVIELLFCVIAIGLIVEPFNNNMQKNFNHAGVIYVALCGYVMINAILILCYLLGEKLGKITATAFSQSGAIMCFTAGVCLIYDWNTPETNTIIYNQQKYLKQMLASGIFSILAALVFVVETIFIRKYE